METDLVISGLLRRRSEIAGDIAHLDSRVDAMRSDLTKLDAALGVLGHEVEGQFLPVRRATVQAQGTSSPRFGLHQDRTGRCDRCRDCGSHHAR